MIRNIYIPSKDVIQTKDYCKDVYIIYHNYI